MQEFILNIISSFGYLGITLLITVENIFPPIPSEVILTFGGFLTTYTSLTVFHVILASTLGSVLGAIILYYIGSILSQERLEKIVAGKVGKILRFKQEDIIKAMSSFETRGNFSVFICRCIPIVRSLISIPAGMTRMHLGKFLILTTLGSFIWNTVLISLGALFGESWEFLVFYVKQYSNVVLIIILVSCVSGFLYSKIKH